MDVLFEVNADASKTREQSHTYTHVQAWPLFGFKAISTTLLRSILKYSHENAHAILFIWKCSIEFDWCLKPLWMVPIKFQTDFISNSPCCELWYFSLRFTGICNIVIYVNIARNLSTLIKFSHQKCIKRFIANFFCPRFGFSIISMLEYSTKHSIYLFVGYDSIYL